MGSGGSTQLLSPGRGWRVAGTGTDQAVDGAALTLSKGGSSERVGLDCRRRGRRVQGHLRLYGQAARIISTG